MSITLEKAQVNGSKLVADFTIDNSHGTKDQVISPAGQFSAKDDDGNTIEFATCDSSSIDGTVLAGDQHKYQICWEFTEEAVPVKIYFNFMTGDANSIIWEVK